MIHMTKLAGEQFQMGIGNIWFDKLLWSRKNSGTLLLPKNKWEWLSKQSFIYYLEVQYNNLDFLHPF